MIDPIDALERALAVAVTIAENESERTTTRLQAVSACTRAASALAAVSGAQSDRQRNDLDWASETIQRTERLNAPEVRLLGIVPTDADVLRQRFASEMIVNFDRAEQGNPDW